MFLSSLIYLFTFACSIFCAYLYGYYANKSSINSGAKTQYVKMFLGFFVIFLPCILAACRDDSVGIDTTKMVNNTFKIAIDSKDFISFYQADDLEILYSLVIYLCAKITNKVWFCLFVIQLLTFYPIWIIAKKQQAKIPPWSIIAFYLFVFYNNSLNLVQQSIACSFTLLTYQYFKDNKKALSAICMIVAVLFHQSVSFMIPVFLICYFVVNKNFAKIKLTLLILGIIAIYFFSGRIFLYLLENTKILPSSYRLYYDVFVTQNTYRNYYINPWSFYCLFDFCMRVMFILVPITIFHAIKNEKYDNKEYFLITAIGLCIYSLALFGLNTMYGGRITLCCDYFTVLLVPSITSRKFKSGRIFFWLMILLYWYVFIIRLGWSGSSIYHLR